jgi:hypothetical protein
MQGLESLNQFQNFMSSVGGLGRFEDTYMVHAAEGETVVPMEVLDKNPLLKERLFESMRDMGIQPERYIVGNEFNSLNPLTGQPEFFLKSIGRRLRKAAADISGYAAPIAGAMFGAPAGAATGALLGQYKRENPGDPNQALRMALLGGAAGVAGNLAKGRTGMGLLTGGGFGVPEGLTGILGGGRDLISAGYEGGKKLLLGEGTDKGIISKALSSLKGTSLEDAIDAVKKAHPNWEPEEVLAAAEKISGKSNTLLKGLLGIGGTLGLGKLIGEPEDITVDASKIRTAPVSNEYAFSPTTPVTVDTGYNIPITPYQAAEGGIIGYNEGGFSGSPHGYGEMDGPFYRGEDEGSAPDMPGLPYDDMMKNMMMEFLQKEFMNNPSAFEQKYGNDTAEFMRQMMGLRTKEQLEKDTGAIFDPESSEIIGYNLNKGGIMDLRGGGFSQGPGTGTSDSIPAMLSDGEFVMTADAVRGAGGGDRREGAKRMYEMMDRLETRA